MNNLTTGVQEQRNNVNKQQWKSFQGLKLDCFRKGMYPTFQPLFFRTLPILYLKDVCTKIFSQEVCASLGTYNLFYKNFGPVELLLFSLPSF